MYNECRNYLIEVLKAAGIKTQVHTNQKTLDNDNENHKGAVITDTDEFERSGQKVNYRDAEDKKHKRTKTFDRKLTFIVTIGEYSFPETEKIFEAFLSNIGAGIYIDGNYVSLTILPASWYDEEDKIINSKAAVVFKVCFSGGVYKDTDYLKIGVVIEAPEMEEGNIK